MNLLDRNDWFRGNAPYEVPDRRFMVIEGPLGAGKTTLSRLLAGKLQAKTVFEPENPFFPEFFRDMARNAFQAQIFTLLTRYQQQKEILQVDLFNQGVIADYLFTSEHIFAEQHLSHDEFMLYDKLLKAMNLRTPIPDLVVYLQSPPEVLLERLQRSGKSYGRLVPYEYLVSLCQAYNNYFFKYNLSPLLVVNTEHIDFVHEERHLVKLVEEMKNVDRGVHHFVPMEK